MKIHRLNNLDKTLNIIIDKRIRLFIDESCSKGHRLFLTSGDINEIKIDRESYVKLSDIALIQHLLKMEYINQSEYLELLLLIK